MLGSTDLPLYGVAGFEGARWVSRFGGDWIAFAHGQLSGEPPHVEIGVLRAARAPRHPEVEVSINVFETLESLLLLDTLSELDAASAREQLEKPRPLATGEKWSPAILTIDETDEDGLFYSERERWVTFVERPSCWIYAFSFGVPVATWLSRGRAQ